MGKIRRRLEETRTKKSEYKKAERKIIKENQRIMKEKGKAKKEKEDNSKQRVIRKERKTEKRREEEEEKKREEEDEATAQISRSFAAHRGRVPTMSRGVHSALILATLILSMPLGVYRGMHGGTQQQPWHRRRIIHSLMNSLLTFRANIPRL